MKAIEKIEVIELKDQDQSLGFKFSYLPTPAKRLLKAQNLSFAYNKDEWLYQNLSFELTPEDRIAIVGQNGKGKTTLLRHLAQEISNAKDEVWLHPQTKIGFYHQTNKKDLNLNATVADEIAQTNPLLTITQVRAICGAVMFTGDDALKKISVLSGGEQARVLLGKILAFPNNCLLLDEPSNHLDRDAVEKLGDEVKKFEGPVVFVTHHEGLLHKLATHLIYFKNGQAHFFAGNYQDFLDKVGWSEDEPVSKKEEVVVKSAAEHQELRKKTNRLKKSLEKLEDEILNMEEELETYNKKLEDIVMSDASDKNQLISDHYKVVGQKQNALQDKYTELEKITSELEGL